MEAIILSVSASRTATLVSPTAPTALGRNGLDVTTDKGPAVAAIELIKKWRLFIRDFLYWPPARDQYISDCPAFRRFSYLHVARAEHPEHVSTPAPNRLLSTVPRGRQSCEASKRMALASCGDSP